MTAKQDPAWPDGLPRLGEAEARAFIASARTAFLAKLHAVTATAERKRARHNQIKSAESFARKAAETRLWENELAVWCIVARLLPTNAPWSVAAVTSSFALAVRDMDKHFAGNPAGWRTWLRSRELGPGQRAGDWNQGRRPAGSDKRPTRGQRPRGDTVQMRQHLERSLKILREAGWDPQLQLVRRDHGRLRPTNHADFATAAAPFEGTRHAEGRAAVATLLAMPNLKAFRQARVSWIKRDQGAWYIEAPWGSWAWLGPYYRLILGQADRRLEESDDPDPLLFPHHDKTGADIEHHDQSLRALMRKVLGQERSPMDLVLRARAELLAAGFSVHYVLQASDLRSEHSVQAMEDLQARVQLATAQGWMASQGPPQRTPRDTSAVACPACPHDEVRGAPRCGSCLTPLPPTSTPLESALRATHRLLDDVLLMRGQTEAEREQAHTDLVERLRAAVKP